MGKKHTQLNLVKRTAPSDVPPPSPIVERARPRASRKAVQGELFSMDSEAARAYGEQTAVKRRGVGR